MHYRKKVEHDIYNLKNCFGFDENDINVSFSNNTCEINDTIHSVEFQQNKPYRLALYVKPKERRKFNSLNYLGESNKSILKNQKRLLNLNAKKTVKNVQKMMLFDENIVPETSLKKAKKTPERNKVEEVIKCEGLNSRKKVLAEVNSKPITKTKQSKIRKSYERKFKENISETVCEPHSDEIIKELDIKKLGCKSRAKKTTTKEDQEFEKWAKDMNSDFNDVDKFELSITYD